MPAPLEGITLKTMVTDLVERYGFEKLAASLPIRCFMHEPSVSSSLHFLRRTPWARARLEDMYLQHLKWEAEDAAIDAAERARSESEGAQMTSSSDETVELVISEHLGAEEPANEQPATKAEEQVSQEPQPESSTSKAD